MRDRICGSSLRPCQRCCHTLHSLSQEQEQSCDTCSAGVMALTISRM